MGGRQKYTVILHNFCIHSIVVPITYRYSDLIWVRSQIAEILVKVVDVTAFDFRYRPFSTLDSPLIYLSLSYDFTVFQKSKVNKAWYSCCTQLDCHQRANLYIKIIKQILGLILKLFDLCYSPSLPHLNVLCYVIGYG